METLNNLNNMGNFGFLKNFDCHRKNAHDYHNKMNCKYDVHDYIYHLDMVVDVIIKNKDIFNYESDYILTHIAGYYHDCIEDAQLTFNDVKMVTSTDVARIVLAVTDVHEENRLLRHLMTMGKTVKDYRAIVLKLCDIHANASYSKANGSSMYKKYKKEYEYRRPIFKTALNWYTEHLNIDVVTKLWEDLDEIHDYVEVV